MQHYAAQAFIVSMTAVTVLGLGTRGSDRDPSNNNNLSDLSTQQTDKGLSSVWCYHSLSLSIDAGQR